MCEIDRTGGGVAGRCCCDARDKASYERWTAVRRGSDALRCGFSESGDYRLQREGHYRAQAGGGGDTPCDGGSGGGNEGEVELPGEHEPRDPHADERHHRHVAPGAARRELTPRQRDYIAKIQQSGQHLLGIINDILDFSKVEAGKLTWRRIDFDLEKLLDNVSNLIAEKAIAKGLELMFDVGPGRARII